MFEAKYLAFPETASKDTERCPRERKKQDQQQEQLFVHIVHGIGQFQTRFHYFWS